MFDFNAPQKCSQCADDEYTLFAGATGQGIRCRGCGHEKVICRPQTRRHKTKFRARMAVAWNAQKKRSEY